MWRRWRWTAIVSLSMAVIVMTAWWMRSRGQDPGAASRPCGRGAPGRMNPPHGAAIPSPGGARIRGGQDLASTIAALGEAVGPALRQRCARAGLGWPPADLLLLAIKQTRSLEVWGRGPTTGWRPIATYPFTAFSGDLGPKLAEGDRQIPEGIYRATCLNPQSSYHLSIRLDYPNAFDRRMAIRDGRARLGGDIYIHGDRKTIGCISIGDAAIEELFLLVHACGLAATEVIMMPYDLRRETMRATTGLVAWEDDLYRAIARHLADLGMTPAAD